MKKNIIHHMSVEMLKKKKQPRKENIIDKTWRKEVLYDKQRCKSLHRSDSCESSTSDLEAKTAFRFHYDASKSTKSHALRRVFDRGSRPRKSTSPISMLAGRRKESNNSKNVSPLISNRLQKEYYSLARALKIVLQSPHHVMLATMQAQMTKGSTQTVTFHIMNHLVILKF